MKEEGLICPLVDVLNGQSVAACLPIQIPLQQGINESARASAAVMVLDESGLSKFYTSCFPFQPMISLLTIISRFANDDCRTQLGGGNRALGLRLNEGRTKDTRMP